MKEKSYVDREIAGENGPIFDFIVGLRRIRFSTFVEMKFNLMQKRSALRQRIGRRRSNFLFFEIVGRSISIENVDRISDVSKNRSGTIGRKIFCGSMIFVGHFGVGKNELKEKATNKY